MTGQGQLLAIHWFRFWGMTLIIASHCKIGLQGGFGNAIFFAIAGFLAASPIIPNSEERFLSLRAIVTYYMRKFIRIIVPYWLILLFFYTLNLASFNRYFQLNDTSSIWANILLINPQGHLWFLQNLLLMYAVTPLILIPLAILKKWGGRDDHCAILLLIITFTLWKFLTIDVFYLNANKTKQVFRIWQYTIGMSGCYFYKYIKSSRFVQLKQHSLSIIPILSIAALIITSILSCQPILFLINPKFKNIFVGWSFPLLSSAFVTILILFSCTFDSSQCKLIHSRIISNLSVSSYCSYLIHWYFIPHFHLGNPVCNFIVIYCVTTSFSYFINKIFEEPFVIISKKIVTRPLIINTNNEEHTYSSRLKIGRSLILYTSLFILVISTHLFAITIGQSPYTLTITAFIICLPELLLALSVQRLFNCMKKPLITAITQIIFLIIYISQAIMFYKTGTLINSLALENLDTLPTLILHYKYYAIIGVAIITIVFLSYYHVLSHSHISTKKSSKSSRKIQFIYITFALILLITFNTNNAINHTFFKSFPNSPIYSLLKNSLTIFHSHLSIESTLHNSNDKYPFFKNNVYISSLPFRLTKETHPKNPNVIVFFIEGLSARTFTDFPVLFPDLTPNLDSFRNNSRTMIVNDYYNHTAATYRGIQGTLGGVYPLKGGRMHNGQGWEEKKGEQTVQKSLPNLISILNTKNYRTIFFSPHLRHRPFTAFLNYLNFKDIYYAEKTLSLLQLPENIAQKDGFLTDKNNLRGLTHYLKIHENNGSPFFIGLYNFQTHSGIDVQPNDHHYADGNNEVLNNIHNLDACWGEFYNYFINSPYYENTILIFTSDHCHYSDVSFRKLAMNNPQYQPYFTDKIPLFIHAPWLNLPHNYSNGLTTSVQFAPSLCHLLGIQEAPNTFMGCSIFEQGATKDYGISYSLGPYYFITPTRIYTEREVPKIHYNTFKKERDLIEHYHYCETTNCVIP